MSIIYIERFEIDGGTWGIEDFEDGRPAEDHFMADRQTTRYKCWHNGCGIGNFKTLDLARRAIVDYALHKAEKKRDEAARSLADSIGVIDKLYTEGAIDNLLEIYLETPK